MGQTVPSPTDIQIRQAIAATIRVGLVKLYGAALGNQVIVHDHWLWGFNLGENASLLRVKEGVEAGKVHGWLIGLNSVQRARPEPTDTRQGVYHLRNRNPNLRNILRSYRVWCYHQLDTGTTDNESNENSENRLAIEIDAVADEFSISPLMGIDNEHLMGNEELQFAPIDVFKFNELQANVAQGTLAVRIRKPLDLNQY